MFGKYSASSISEPLPSEAIQLSQQRLFCEDTVSARAGG